MVKLLLLVNVAVFILQSLAAATVGDRWIYEHLALSERIWKGEVWQVVTYMFLHGDTMHVLFNMLALWMFGKELEMTWGSNEFLKYYMVCGIGGGVTFLFFSQGVVVGASGAVFGILLAFGMTFPNQIIMMSFLFPIKAKFMVIIYGVITFLSIARPGHDGIAHFAHLGGMAFGFLYLKHEWFRWRLSRITGRRRMNFQSRMSAPSASKPATRSDVSLKDRVDAILDKINAVGYDRLTDEEKKTLLEASQHMSERSGAHRPD